MSIDMNSTIAPKSDQINADDLIGGPRTITVTRITGNEGNAEQPVNVFYQNDGGKPFRPCKSMRRVMVKVWGADASQYAGRSMTIYRDPKVKWGGMEVGGIRISHMTGIDKPEVLALTETRAKRTPYTVQPLKVEAPATAPATTDAAAKWATTFIAAVGRAPDLEKLDDYAGKNAERIAGLPDDLRTACETALADKRATFATADEQLPEWETE
jgi:hypothetical protein